MSRIKKALEKAKAQRMALEQERGLPEKRQEPERVDVPRYYKTRIVNIPAEKLLKNKIIAVDEDDPVTDQFKLLRTRILSRTRSEGYNTIQVSGFDSDEGKTLIAVNLAICMAKDTRQTTLLVDVDFRKPTIHKLLGLENDVKGLKSYFEGEAELEELFINPGIEKLTVLPAGGRLTNAPEVVGSPKMEALVKELKGRYPDRYIIFDTPGLNTCPDPLVFSDYVDSMILVARSDYTSQESIKTVMNLIPRQKLLGTVLNDSQWLDSLAYYYKY